MEIPKASDILKSPEDDEKIKMRDLNELAYGDLIMSMNTKTPGGMVAFSLVKSSKSKDYPDGNATISFKKLKDKYAPETGPTLTKLHQQFYSSKLKNQKSADPDIWMTSLEEIRVRMEEMKSVMSDDQFMIYVMNNLTSDYEILVDILGRRIGAAGLSAGHRADHSPAPIGVHRASRTSHQFERTPATRRGTHTRPTPRPHAR